MKHRYFGARFAQFRYSTLAASLVVALLLNVSPGLADESEWSAERCERVKRTLDGQSGPAPILNFDLAKYENLDFNEAETRGGYRVALVGADGTEVEIMPMAGPNNGVGEAYLDAIARYGAADAAVSTMWETYIFLAKHRQEVDEIDCSAEVNADQRMILITYAFYGSEMWPPREALGQLEIVLDEERGFMFLVAEMGPGAYTGVLFQRRGSLLHKILLIHSDEDVIRSSLGRTALLNLE